MSILNKWEPIGSFVVRDSESTPGDYIICVKTPDYIQNIKITYSNGQWFLVGKGRQEQIDYFNSLDELIHFYLKNNTLIATGGATVHPRQPCMANWFCARDIPQRCEYLSNLQPSKIKQKKRLYFRVRVIKSAIRISIGII